MWIRENTLKFSALLLVINNWLPRVLPRQTDYIVIMINEVFTRIVNFMTTVAGVVMLGRGPISHVVKWIIHLKVVFSSPGHYERNWVDSNDEDSREGSSKTSNNQY